MEVKSELRDAQIEITDVDKVHSANTKGMIWFNRALDKLKIMFNSEVKTVAMEDWVEDRLTTEITSSENGLEVNGLLTVEQGSDPSTPPSGKRKVYVKSDGVYEKNSSGAVNKLATQNDVNAITPSLLGSRVFDSVETVSFSSSMGAGTFQVVYTATSSCIVYSRANTPFFTIHRAGYPVGQSVYMEAGDSLRGTNTSGGALSITSTIKVFKF